MINIYLFNAPPKKFSIYDVEAKRLNNVIYYEDKFTYRETLLFMGKAELCLVNEGGLSIGSNVTNVSSSKNNLLYIQQYLTQ